MEVPDLVARKSVSPKPIDGPFHYGRAQQREIYDRKLQELLANKCHKIIDRKYVTKTLARVQKAKQDRAIGCSLSKLQSRTLELFDVILFEDGSHKLIEARKDPSEPIKEYIVAEEAFDILMEAHLATNHGSCNKLMKYAKEKHMIINKACLTILVSVCEFCQKKRKSLKSSKNNKKTIIRSKCFAFIIDMIAYPDGPFNFILVVRDSHTKFVHLRPITFIEENEIGTELFKLFMDFGAPSILAVKGSIFFHGVVTVLKSLWPEYDFIVEKSNVDFQSWANTILHNLNEWTIAAKVKNWSVGCQLTQWKMNNIPEQKQSAYQCTFKTSYQDPLNLITQDKPDDGKLPENLGLFKRHSITAKIVDTETCLPRKIVQFYGNSKNKKTQSNSAQEKLVTEEIVNLDSDQDSNSCIADNSESTQVTQNENSDIEDIHMVLQDDNAKISVVSVEMDIDDEEEEQQVVEESQESVEIQADAEVLEVEEMQDATKCSYCRTNLDKENHVVCHRCSRLVHLACSRKLLMKSTCFTCLTKIKSKLDELKRSMREID